MHRLLKHYREDRRECASSFVKVLNSMCEGDIHDVESEDFECYIKKWTETVNRGGLKILREAAFNFFPGNICICCNC